MTQPTLEQLQAIKIGIDPAAPNGDTFCLCFYGKDAEVIKYALEQAEQVAKGELVLFPKGTHTYNHETHFLMAKPTGFDKAMDDLFATGMCALETRFITASEILKRQELTHQIFIDEAAELPQGVYDTIDKWMKNTSQPKTTIIRGAMGNYNCQGCGKGFQARKADRKRGWARYCSKACKAIKHY